MIAKNLQITRVGAIFILNYLKLKINPSKQVFEHCASVILNFLKYIFIVT